MKKRQWVCLVLMLLPVLLSGHFGQAERSTQVMAHRGASSLAPENTLAAVKTAMDLGADYCEIDVQLTKDGEVVLFHDSRMNRTAGSPEVLSDLTLEQLAQFEVGSWFNAEYDGEPIPTLTDIIRAAKGKMLLNIEIKVSRDETDIASKVVEIIHSEGFREECMITSFDRETIEKVKELDPQITTGIIFSENYPSRVFKGDWEVLSCNYRVVDTEFVIRSRMFKKKIFVWTVDDPEEMRRLVKLEVDGIITNRPQDLIPLVR